MESKFFWPFNFSFVTSYSQSISNLLLILFTGDPPKIPQLLSFKLRNGERIDFVTKIAGREYRKFGQLLLKDPNVINIHEASCFHKPDCVTDRILGDWINGKGVLPVTWEKLAFILDEAGFHLLAHDIRGQYSSFSDEL